MEAGKHIYCDLPLTRYLGEAFQVYDRVKRSGLVFQANALACSSGGWQKGAELIRSGKAGILTWGQASYCRNNPRGEWNYIIPDEISAKDIDWETWLGPVRERIPFNTEHFLRWQKYHAYSCGLGTMQSSRLYAMMLASGKPEYPARVNCVSTRNIQSDLPTAPEREVPEHLQLQAEFPSGWILHITCSTVAAKSSECMLYGHKAAVKLGWGGESVELIPEKEFAHETAAETFEKLQPDDLSVHHKNWFDCIRSGKRPNADIELALKVQTVISLAEMSDRLKITCLFDGESRRITDGTGREITPITYGTMRGS
jgi:predicted dehydrogenase